VILSPQSKYWGDVPPCPMGIDAPGSLSLMANDYCTREQVAVTDTS